MPRRVKIFLLLAVLLPGFQSMATAADGSYRFSGVQRLVVVGDAHGAFDNLSAILVQSGVIDEKGKWTGGTGHLVSLGDFLDRGADSRKIMDLLMDLQVQARKARGKVHVIVGNHELMNLTSDLRDVSLGEYNSYQDLEIAEERESERQRYEALSPEQRTVSFDEKYPAGYFGHRRALSPTGVYGAWLRSQPYMIVINNMALVHGGLPPMVAEYGLEGTNDQLQRMLSNYEEQWQALMGTGAEPIQAVPGTADSGAQLSITDPYLSFDKRLEFANTLPEERGAAFIEASSASLFSPDGPLWAREDSLCIPVTVEDTLLAALERVGVEKVLVGHTPTPDHRIETRMAGRVIMVDTGMQNRVYEGGRASALVVEGGRARAIYLGEKGDFEVKEQARRVGDRPGNMTDDELEEFLTNADIVSMEEVGEGVTHPQIVELERDGIRLKAVFKNVNFREKRKRNAVVAIGDIWRYEVAAYRLDRMLDLRVVPVTVERKIGVETGSLQFWVEGLVNWIKILERDLDIYSGWCPMKPQFELMKAFDALIFNQDRSQQNLNFIRGDWMLVMIDHSRSFEPDKKFPKGIEDHPYLVVRPALARRLESLTREKLDATLEPYLKDRQIKALMVRRDRLLKYELAGPYWQEALEEKHTAAGKDSR
jgi:hypothetical protein